MSTHPRTTRRIERIHAEIPITRVLHMYGFQVRPDIGDREQQFSCSLHGGRDTKPSARVYPATNQWYCVDTDAPVLTDRGWVRLGSVHPGVDTLLDGASEWHTPPAYFDRGTRPVVRVETTAGYDVTLTPDHQIFVIGRGWVEASQLRRGDVLDIPKPTVPKFNPGLDLPFDPSDLNAESYIRNPNLNLPSVWNEQLGMVLGYIFGDGWIITRKGSRGSPYIGLTASVEDADDTRKIFRILQEWSNRRGSERHVTSVTTLNGHTYRQSRYNWTLGNGGMVEFLQRLGLDKKMGVTERRLPHTLWSAPECAVRGFLRGIYATDGSVIRAADRTAIRVNLYSVSRRFLQDIQLLLLQFGIHSRIHAGATTRTSKVLYLQLATGSDIVIFRERIGISLPRKQALLDGYRQVRPDRKPFRARVVSVTNAGMRPVADVAMPSEHSFVAGGIRVHNCWTCSKSRDAISTVREKDGIDFHAAIVKLESLFNLPPLPWEDGDTEPKPVDIFATPQTTDADRLERVGKILYGLTKERALPFDTTINLWERYDRLASLSDTGDLVDEIAELRDDILRIVKSCTSST